jgi:hypothetical protein
MKGCALLQGSQQWGDVSGGMRMVCIGEQDMLLALVQTESGDVWMPGGRPYSQGD